MTRFADTFLANTQVGLDTRSNADRLALAREAEARRAALDQMRAEAAAERLALAQAGLDERTRQFDERQALAGDVAAWREEQARAKMESGAANAATKQQEAEREEAGRRALALMVGGQGGISGDMFGPPSPEQSAQVDALSGLPASVLGTMAGGVLGEQRKRASQQIDEQGRQQRLKEYADLHAALERDIGPRGRAYGNPLKTRAAIEEMQQIRAKMDQLEGFNLPAAMYNSGAPTDKPAQPNAAAVDLLRDLKLSRNVISSQLRAGASSDGKPTPVYANLEKTKLMSRSQAERYLMDIEPLIERLESMLVPADDGTARHPSPFAVPPWANHDATVPAPGLTPQEEERAAELMDVEGLTFEQALGRVQGEREDDD